MPGPGPGPGSFRFRVSPISIAVCALIATAVGGCGGGDETDAIKKAVKGSVTRAVDDSTFQLNSPGYLDSSTGSPAAQALSVKKQGKDAATVTGQVRVEVRVRPQPDKAGFLRVVPKSGGTVSAVRRFKAQATKQGDGSVTGEDGPDFEDEPGRELKPQEVEQARQFAVKAMTSLLTFDGDVRAYNGAQGDFYATKRASDADFNQPAFDPAPSLDLKTSLGLAAWPRTNDGGKDDLGVDSVFPYRAPGAAAECSLELKSMRPSTVSGEVMSGSSRRGPIEDKVLVSGQVVVRAGEEVCRKDRGFGSQGPPVRMGTKQFTAKYLVSVSRLSFGARAWFISGADLDNEVASGSHFGGGGPRLYDTGSGETQVLAAP